MILEGLTFLFRCLISAMQCSPQICEGQSTIHPTIIPSHGANTKARWMCSYRNQTPNPQTTIACISETKSTCISFCFHVIIRVFSSGQDGAAHRWKPSQLVLVSSGVWCFAYLCTWASILIHVVCGGEKMQQCLCDCSVLGLFWDNVGCSVLQRYLRHLWVFCWCCVVACLTKLAQCWPGTTMLCCAMQTHPL